MLHVRDTKFLLLMVTGYVSVMLEGSSSCMLSAPSHTSLRTLRKLRMSKSAAGEIDFP